MTGRMARKRIAVIMGTRPEAIKLAPVVVALRAHAPWCEAHVVATAQHRDLLDQVLQVFDLAPDVDLNLMQQGQGLGELTARLISGLDALWRRERPDLVLVQGDTTSAMAASLAAYYSKVPVGHVEAGLRSFDKYAPYPEEMNRRIVDVLADYYFAPTEQSRRNLLAEGVPSARITVTGNPGIDALLLTAARLRARPFVPQVADPAVFQREPLILVTAHRRESFGPGLEAICGALRAIGEARPDAAILYPVHPNPNVQGPVTERLGGVPNIHLTMPLDYPTFVYAMGRAQVILTDSGGVQEEVSSLGKRVLVMRELTERTEALDAGIAELVGTRQEAIVAKALEWLDRPAASRYAGLNPYGDGRASERIVRALAEALA